MELYTAIVLITVALLGVTIVDIRSNRVIDHQLKRNSIVTCLLIGLAIFFEWAGIKANHMDVSWIFLHKLVKLAEFPERVPYDDGPGGDGPFLLRAHDGREFRAAQERLPRFDAVHVPGGDDDGGGVVRV